MVDQISNVRLAFQLNAPSAKINLSENSSYEGNNIVIYFLSALILLTDVNK